MHCIRYYPTFQFPDCTTDDADRHQYPQFQMPDHTMDDTNWKYLRYHPRLQIIDWITHVATTNRHHPHHHRKSSCILAVTIRDNNRQFQQFDTTIDDTQFHLAYDEPPISTLTCKKDQTPAHYLLILDCTIDDTKGRYTLKFPLNCTINDTIWKYVRSQTIAIIVDDAHWHYSHSYYHTTSRILVEHTHQHSLHFPHRLQIFSYATPNDSKHQYFQYNCQRSVCTTKIPIPVHQQPYIAGTRYHNQKWKRPEGSSIPPIMFWFHRHASKNGAQYTIPSVSTHTNHHLLSHCSLKDLTHCDECRATAYWTQLQTVLHNSPILSNNSAFNNRIFSDSDTNDKVSDTIPTTSLHCCCFFIIPKDTRQQTHSQMTVTYNNDSSYHRFHLETFEYIRSFSDRNDHIFG